MGWQSPFFCSEGKMGVFCKFNRCPACFHFAHPTTSKWCFAGFGVVASGSFVCLQSCYICVWLLFLMLLLRYAAGTSRISLHYFVFGLFFVLRNHFSSDFSERLLANYFVKFLRSFHKLHWDPVVACGPWWSGSFLTRLTTISKMREVFSQSTSHSPLFLWGMFWEVLCEKCSADFTAHFTEKWLGEWIVSSKGFEW